MLTFEQILLTNTIRNVGKNSEENVYVDIRAQRRGKGG